ncbi:MAG: 4Fe-4S dicluster domain-containing protein, partial [Thermodesulfobacteriota bacterium]
WFTLKVGILGHRFSPAQRFGAAIKGILGIFFSTKILVLIRSFFLDVVLQLRIAREDRLRWIMHLLIYGGFLLLLFMHALEKHITARLFSDYYSTVNPFFFLRDFFGLLVIIGVGIAITRRYILKVPRMMTNAMDRYALIILGVIMISGVALEGVKISSHSEFQRMVDDYAGMDDPDEIKALESYWIQEYGTVSPNLKGPFDSAILDQGYELHQSNCAGCHSPNKSAFVGYATAKAISPVARAVDQADGVTVLWYIHIFSCFFGLAYLPFSKMFHIFASSISLMAGAVMDPAQSDPANIATRQAMELDACTHCGTCSLRCSVAVAFEALHNRTILPGEKLSFLKSYASKRELNSEELRPILEGIYLCTNCDRCTVVCPAGINLRDLWFNVREELISRDAPVPLALSPFSFYRGLNQDRMEPAAYEKPLVRTREALVQKFALIKKPDAVIPLTPIDKGFKGQAARSFQAGTFGFCFSCENCTTVCPVVGSYENPQERVGLLPHQIMRSLGLGLKDLALGSKMLWDCLTCYQCQEHCPQGVKVTDVLYELKNMTIKEIRNAS